MSARPAALAALLLGAIASGAAAAPRSVTYAQRTMGTYVHVALVTEDSAASAPLAARGLACFTRVDSLMSNWTTTSEVARINREAAVPGGTGVEREVAKVIALSLDLWRETEGAYDITVEPLVRLWGFLGGPRRVPSDGEIAAILPRVGARHVHFDRAARRIRFDQPGVKIDLGGIAKGYAVDVAADTLRARGVRDALVDVSGNMFALGTPPGASAWHIGIRDPRDRIPFFARIDLTGQGISTSGQYEQFIAANGRTYGHILDPHTGRPADGLISVTIVSPSALTCDAWDTPLFVLGPERAKRVAKTRHDIAAILVAPGNPRDTVWVEESLRDRFHFEPEAESLFVVKWF
jgi:thiamine biosynthesis lipoprotein